MRKLDCNSITGLECKFIALSKNSDNLILTLLTHINEIHDPNFVARCKDDLYVEYSDYLIMINE